MLYNVCALIYLPQSVSYLHHFFCSETSMKRNTNTPQSQFPNFSQSHSYLMTCCLGHFLFLHFCPILKVTGCSECFLSLAWCMGQYQPSLNYWYPPPSFKCVCVCGGVQGSCATPQVSSLKRQG